MASLYETFPAAETRRLVERFEWHYPKTLQLARSSGVRTWRPKSQCLNRRIPDKQTLIDEIAAWQHDRNSRHTKANCTSQPLTHGSNSGTSTPQSD
jgi:hypothetical protein